MKLAFHITLFVLLLLSSFVTMPHEHLTVSQRGEDASDCDINQYEDIFKSAPTQKPELDSRGFKVLNWNVLRGEKKEWKKDFSHLTKSQDILTIQEARLTDYMRELLKKRAL